MILQNVFSFLSRSDECKHGETNGIRPLSALSARQIDSTGARGLCLLDRTEYLFQIRAHSFIRSVEDALVVGVALFATLLVSGSAWGQVPGSSGQLLYNSGGSMAAAPGITTPDGHNLESQSLTVASSGIPGAILYPLSSNSIYLQPNSANSNAQFRILPSGTANAAGIVAYNGSTITGGLIYAGDFRLRIEGATAQLQSELSAPGEPGTLVTTQNFGEDSSASALTNINWQFNGVTQASLSNAGVFTAAGAAFTGNVGIGVTNPVSKLAVNGKVSASEVVVTSSPADYVFDQDYRLAPLSEVADYVAANHHLPGIPSAAEVVENGVGLGEMQSKLLAKIEELTLHMIEAERENQELRDRVARLEHEAAGGAK
jgi:hypothetical protein